MTLEQAIAYANNPNSPRADAIQIHDVGDEADAGFQEALHRLADRCSACGQPMPEEAGEMSGQAVALTRRPLPDRLRYCAQILDELPKRGPHAAIAVARILETTAAELEAARPSRPVLSERELQALRGVARGLSREEIAVELGLSAKTVGSHLRGAYARLGATRLAAVAVAARLGLLDEVQR